MQKGFSNIFLVISLLVIALIGGAIYFGKVNLPRTQTAVNPEQQVAKSTVDETANWKTYTSTKYGFSVKYPPELENYILKNDNSFSISYPGPSDVSLFTIHVYETTSSPTDWWNQVGKTKYPGIFNTAFNQIEISGPNGESRGIKGTEVLGQRKSPGGATLSTSLYLIPHNNYLFVLSDNSYEENNYDKIIKTFVFLNQVSTTFDWKTYTKTDDKNNRYEVKYPPDWIVEANSLGDVQIYSPTAKYTLPYPSIKTDKAFISTNGDFVIIKCPWGSGKYETELKNPKEDEPNEEGFTTRYSENITLNGMKGIQWVWGTNDQKAELTTEVLRQQNPYTCSFRTNIQKSDQSYKQVIQSLTIYNQIISTFKFN